MNYVGAMRQVGPTEYSITIPAFRDGREFTAATPVHALERAIVGLEDVVLERAKAGTLPPPDAGNTEDGGHHQREHLHTSDEQLYRLPVSAYAIAKLSFARAFLASDKTRTQFAEELGKSENEIRRMLDPTYPTKMPMLEHGLRALGKRLSVKVEELPAVFDF